MTEQDLALAGNYVLGLLEGAELASFEQALARDGDLRAAVDRLQQQFHALDDTATPAEASPALWAAISHQLDGAPSATVVPLKSRRSTAGKLAQWYGLAASVVLALGLGYAVGSMTSAQPKPTVIAVLLNESNATPGAIIEAFADDSVRLVPLEDFALAAGQVLEVWTLPNAETGPVSLGTFTDTETLRLSGPKLPTPRDGQLYEITVEQAPRSATGKPTGPILVKGFAKAPI